MGKQKEYELSGCASVCECVCLEEKFGDIRLQWSWRVLDAGVLQPGALTGGVFY